MTKDGACVRDDISLTSPELVHLSAGTMVYVNEVVLDTWSSKVWSQLRWLHFDALGISMVEAFRGILRHVGSEDYFDEETMAHRKRGRLQQLEANRRTRRLLSGKCWENVAPTLTSTEISRNDVWVENVGKCLFDYEVFGLSALEPRNPAGWISLLDSDTGYRFAERSKVQEPFGKWVSRQQSLQEKTSEKCIDTRISCDVSQFCSPIADNSKHFETFVFTDE